ncbi:uncharacterized protein N7515_010226 [Penicillium bovifimosum]|uniref:Uncharacterized protein n=1 Tax=Penicillium bovifimosum TaxID=126998 RepID=A0A9W9GI45_9EURO|nr:uncharacterized protein N7515_010226 [Penicillium bovifimosum]KAJ5120838.1 hypothetical protein N7515_010226 [Penicillium bovifimosum]
MATRSSVQSDNHASGLTYEPFESSYVRMIVEADEIAWQDNILASAAHWILLAGYLVVPGTFTSLQKSDTIHTGLAQNEAGEWILNTIQNPPLLATACVLFVSGLTIMGWLFREYRGNYIWLINRIFIPTLLNALAGFLTTIVSLYTAHNGDWSIMVLLTVITSGLSVACSLILLYIYKFGKVQRLKQEHKRMVRNREQPLHV